MGASGPLLDYTEPRSGSKGLTQAARFRHRSHMLLCGPSLSNIRPHVMPPPGKGGVACSIHSGGTIEFLEMIAIGE